MSIENEALKVFIGGGIVIFPTDTVYGIGCRIDDDKAVRRLFTLRRRPREQAVPVLVGSIVMAEKYLSTPLFNDVRQLMDRFWPGALTVVYPCKTKLVSPLVRGNGVNLGVRMPNHKMILELINKVNVPILGPSANFHGGKTIFKYEDLDPELVKLVDYVVKGQSGGLEASTVINCSSKPWKILRQGKVIVS